ncbi:hypothetical protein [Limnobacter alexandrii]|jgi:hypothetical protein|uniref:hypothetical protein n=1 Tax=Limnobacter alexandrii TaxID=2570352 RepID=UPI001107A93D|nr:hypothetical protein [Limnobacter alexandrii]
METRKQVLIVGLQPELIDFSSPEYAAFPGLTAEKILQGLNAGAASLQAQGYDAQICLTDFGATADMVLRNALSQKQFDCVLVGAGVRTVPTHFLLFETIINTIHTHAPGAKICFNTNPGDTAEAVKRWI